MKYKYLSTQVPRVKIDYSYSVFEGERFLDAWFTSRQVVQGNNDSVCYKLNRITGSSTEGLFLEWIGIKNNKGELNKEKLNLLVKRFEVTKKIYSSYDENFRPKDKSLYNEYRLYQLFSLVLCKEYADSNRLPLLNALLKLNDIVLSVYEIGEELDVELLRETLAQEVRFVLELRRD
ncbi:hypothetical protein [Roseivirga thermotolerans]|uniref:ApeA N-terminal domain-containing protein n=1 Tax=Roseivirga thermotolerans TaxID=1758176 RepID=A0ABQ3I976_9BACT|nr:hypothetical protein [Roseivirga thermotolerans]GHE68551.1 hypothetical protein GCM10011340_25430 [Roseivirga thermotolerans]